MKQVFSKTYHKKFIEYFNIKKNPSKIETDFYKKTTKYIKYIKWIPGLRMIWIWNSISMNSATQDSDIDLYIVSNNNSMWFVRIMITFIFQILWVRKTPKKHAWRFCLSFFSTLDWMDFSNFKLENDIYLYFWIIYFKPILDYNNTYNKFIEQNSNWANFSEYKDVIEDNKQYIKYKKPLSCAEDTPSDKFISPYQEKEDKILILLNNILEKIFLNKTIKHFEKIWKPYGVIINDNLLKFHNDDVREKLKKELL